MQVVYEILVNGPNNWDKQGSLGVYEHFHVARRLAAEACKCDEYKGCRVEVFVHPVIKADNRNAVRVFRIRGHKTRYRDDFHDTIRFDSVEESIELRGALVPLRVESAEDGGVAVEAASADEALGAAKKWYLENFPEAVIKD